MGRITQALRSNLQLEAPRGHHHAVDLHLHQVVARVVGAGGDRHDPVPAPTAPDADPAPAAPRSTWTPCGRWSRQHARGGSRSGPRHGGWQRRATPGSAPTPLPPPSRTAAVVTTSSAAARRRRGRAPAARMARASPALTTCAARGAPPMPAAARSARVGPVGPTAGHLERQRRVDPAQVVQVVRHRSAHVTRRIVEDQPVQQVDGVHGDPSR